MSIHLSHNISMINYWFHQGTPSYGKQMIRIDETSFTLYIPHLLMGSLSVSVYCSLFAGVYELEFYAHWDETWLGMQSI